MAIKTEKIPRLENGDHLSRPEFEHRYHGMPNDQKAELVEGVVYLVPHTANKVDNGEGKYKSQREWQDQRKS